MSTTIDERVVEMRFDNKHFEKNVSETMSTLEKFKQKLNLTGASKGLENINSSVSKINLNGLNNAIDIINTRFSNLGIMGVTALANITNAAVNAGKRMVSALTIDPIKTGFSEYETQINAVQTILANTESKGTTLQDVNRALDELNLYADKTIYNFTEMTKNIGTFTAAGIDLKTSVSAIQGIANLAAVSGSTSQQASTAMYQLSQALASGTVKLMDWNSVVNAGMGGQVFQDALKETARVHGVNVDRIIKQEGSFRESLKEGWLTAEVLTDTLNKFTMAAEEGSEQWLTYKKSLIDEGYTEKQAESILKMANTATDAATKVKTFTQLWDTLKESAQSGWTSTWEIIVGDFGEAKEFLTTISNTVGGMLSASAEARNNLLSGGLSSGWKQLLNAGIADEEGYKESILNVAKENGFAFDELIKETEKNGGTYNDALKKALSEGKINSDMLTTSVSKLSEKMQGLSAKEREAAGYTAEHIQQIKELDEGLKNGSISMDEFVKKMMRSSGRENLIEALTNAFKGLMNIISPIKEAFREVFPAMQSEELYNITVKIKEMTANFREFTEKHAPQIKSTFKGIFDVIGVGISFVKDVSSGVLTLLRNFTGFTGGVLDATAAMGTFLSNISKTVRESDLFGKTIDKVVGFLQNGINKIKEFGGPGLSGLLSVLKGILGFVTTIGSKLGKVIGEAIGNGDILGVMNIFNTGVISAILMNINNFVKNIKGSFDNFADVLDNLKGVLESYQQSLKAETLMKIAKAIGILALSIVALALIKPERLSSAVTAISILFGELLASLGIFTKIAPNLKNMFSASTALMSLSSAILVLSLALKVIGSMNWQELAVGLTGITVGLGVLVGAVWLLPDKKVNQAAKAIGKLCTSLLVFSVAMKIMGSMSWSEIGRGLTVMATGLIALVAAVNLLPKDTALRSAGMIGLTMSLVILGGALKIMATMSWSDIGRGLTVLTGGLAALVLAINLLPKDTALKTLGMIGLTTSLVILAGALKIMATMSWNEIGRGLTVMGVALLELVIALNLMKGAIAGSAALIIASGALVILASALKILGSMSWESIIKGLVTIAGAFTILGLAGLILTPLIPTLLSLSGAFALFGVSVLAIGAGLLMISAAIGALATSLSVGATAIVAGLSAIVLGFLGLIPEIIKVLGESIVVICQVIMECAPTIAETILTVLDSVFQSLAEHAPSIVANLAQFLIGVLQSLRDYLPGIIVAAVEVIGAFFQGVVDAIKGIDTTSLFQGIIGIGLLTGLMYLLSGVAALIPGAMVGVLGLGVVIAELALVLAAIGALSKIPGLSWLIEEGGNFLQKIGTAIGQFIGGLIGGIALGATSTLPQVGANLSMFMLNLTPFLAGVKMVDENMLDKVAALAGAIVLLTGANLISGIASFMSCGSSLSELGAELSMFMLNATGFIAGASVINPAMLEGVRALADTILILTAADVLNGLTSWLTGGQSLSEFGSQLGGLGTNLNQFATNLGTFSEQQVASVTCACAALKSLAEAANSIPNEGGLWSKIVGDNGIAAFSEKLPGLATHIATFVSNLGTFGDEQIKTVDSACKAITAIAKLGEIDIDSTGSGLLSFGNNMVTFASKVKTFVNNIGKVGSDGIESAINKTKELIEMAKNVADTNIDSVKKFGESLKDFAKDGVKGFVEEFSGEEPKEKAKKAVGKLIEAGIKGAEDKESDVKDAFEDIAEAGVDAMCTKSLKDDAKQAGKDLVVGFANGIKNNESLATNAGSSLGKAALKAAKKAIDSNSPSKEAYKLGTFFDQGFVNGIKDYASKVYDVSYGMADNAKQGLSRAISKISELVNNDIDTQPTIRPVLDLTDVESGAGYLSSIFSDGPSVGVAANLRAISSGMNAKIQNGPNDDVISAINKLRKDLGNVGGNTYNVNGITYDDGSNVANTVKDLVRAAKIERRV